MCNEEKGKHGFHLGVSEVPQQRLSVKDKKSLNRKRKRESEQAYAEGTANPKV